jgi:hypothetical protein
MSHEYLSDSNKEQRRAVEHGIDTECATTAPPLRACGFAKDRESIKATDAAPKKRAGPRAA